MQQLKGEPVKESYIWRGSNALAFVFIQEEPNGTFRGNCSIVVGGETVSKSTGGQFNIGDEWTDPGRAVNDLAVILFHEVHKHPEINDADALAEIIARGRATASSSHDFRHDPADDLIRDLLKSCELIREGSLRALIDEKVYAEWESVLRGAISEDEPGIYAIDRDEDKVTIVEPESSPAVDPFFIPVTHGQMELFDGFYESNPPESL